MRDWPTLLCLVRCFFRCPVSPRLNLAFFWAASLVSLFTFRNVIKLKHLKPAHTCTPPAHLLHTPPRHTPPPKTHTHEHPNTRTPKLRTGMSRVFVKTLPLSTGTFSPKNTDYIVCPAPSVFLYCLVFFCLSWFSSMCCFLCFLLFFVPSLLLRLPPP